MGARSVDTGAPAGCGPPGNVIIPLRNCLGRLPPSRSIAKPSRPLRALAVTSKPSSTPVVPAYAFTLTPPASARARTDAQFAPGTRGVGFGRDAGGRPLPAAGTPPVGPLPVTTSWAQRSLKPARNAIPV